MIYKERGNEKKWRFLISGQDSKLSIIGRKKHILTSNVSGLNKNKNKNVRKRSKRGSRVTAKNKSFF